MIGAEKAARILSGKRLPRLVVRLICFASAGVLLWPALPWQSAPKFVAQISPFAAISSSIAFREVAAGAGIGLVFALVAVLRRRWFCRYICPAGLLLEGAAKVGFQKTSWWSRCPPLGRYAAVLTLAGAVIGYPVLLWMDPLAIFSSSFAACGAFGAISGILAGLGLAILILLTLTSGTIWCARICPLGGTQELLASARSLWPAQAEPGPQLRLPLQARRAFILGAAGTGIGMLARKAGAARGEEAPLRPPGAVAEDVFAGACARCGNCVRACPSRIIHHDTGQAGIAGLLAPVIRYDRRYCLEDCLACTQVCPSGALRKMNLEQKQRYVIGEALVDGSLCLVTLGLKDCDACERSCPFDAVHIHWDEEQYVAYPMVDIDRCNGCGACEVACPTERFKAIRVWKRIDLR